jgi:hypothetical protein
LPLYLNLGIGFDGHKLNKGGGTLNTQEIVKELVAEINRLHRAVEALDGATTTAATVASNKPSRKSARTPRKHHMTVAGRKRLSMLMKKRWAAKRKKNLAGRK